MKDLGTMGESTFSLWCAQSGLIANGSIIDKTGWDFYVEFPFDSSAEIDEVHKAAIECKVQVKATDGKKGKLSISLSNLRRMVTAQMPSFFVFIEFDGQSAAQRAYIVHVDFDLTSSILKKLHEINQEDAENKFNKRTMTIHYNESHMMESVDGETLKNVFLNYVGSDMAKYVSRKKKYLESVGYENGFAQVKFTIQGKKNLERLIDVSLGLEESVNIKSITAKKTRFGIQENSLFIDRNVGWLGLPDLKPYSFGTIQFQEDRLSIDYSFPAKLYISPLRNTVPECLIKARIEGDFFDFIVYPFTGKMECSFSFGEGVRLEVNQFRSALRLLSCLCRADNILYSKLVFDNFPDFSLTAECHGQEFLFFEELKTLTSACNILANFEIANEIDISLGEISNASDSICNFDAFISDWNTTRVRVEFDVEDENFTPKRETACICLTSIQIGSHVIGVLFVVTGDVLFNKENCRYELSSTNVTIEKKIILEKDSWGSKRDLLSAIKPIEKKYSTNYQTVVIQN